MQLQQTIFDNSMKKTVSLHYYGDIVRRLLLFGGYIILLFTPFFKEYIPVPLSFSLLIVIFLSIFSGLTNPKNIWTAVFDVVISLGGVIAFGYYAIDTYVIYGYYNSFFWVNQLLAILFLTSLYLSVKTVRGFIQKIAESE